MQALSQLADRRFVARSQCGTQRLTLRTQTESIKVGIEDIDVEDHAAWHRQPG